MPKEVEIGAAYVGDQPLLMTLEGCLDPEKVSVRRTEYAVKAIFPLDLIIKAVSLHAFEKLVLDPLVEPLVEKFNWVAATKKLLRPHQPFNVTVRIRDNSFIEAPLELDHALVGQIWIIIRRAIDILRAEGFEGDTGLLRITSDAPGRPLVIAYSNSRPTWVVDLTQGRTRDVERRGGDPDSPNRPRRR